MTHLCGIVPKKMNPQRDKTAKRRAGGPGNYYLQAVVFPSDQSQGCGGKECEQEILMLMLSWLRVMALEVELSIGSCAVVSQGEWKGIQLTTAGLSVQCSG